MAPDEVNTKGGDLAVLMKEMPILRDLKMIGFLPGWFLCLFVFKSVCMTVYF